MQAFGAAMRGYIRGGLTPASAMRSAWADVRRGTVSRPQRRARSARRNAPWRDYTVPGDGRFVIDSIGRKSDGKTIAYQLRHSATDRGPTESMGPYFRHPAPARRYASRWAAARGLRVPANPGRPTLGRVGELVARIVAQSGADLAAVADAHARVYGYPRGDVYEMARQWLTRRSMRGNPLTRAETGQILVAARDDMRFSRRPPSLSATGRADPRVRERHIGWWRGRADGLLGVVGSFGTTRRLTHERRGSVAVRRTGARLSRVGVGPGLNPGRPVVIYDRVLKIYARKGRGVHRGQQFVHTFRSGARMLGLPNGDLLITGR